MKASIVIPLYNGEKYLVKCLESVLNQDYCDYEVIIIDDGSSDASLDIACKYESSKVHVYTQENSGVAEARNKGIEKCSEDSHCVFFVDCDDCISPSYLSLLLSNFNPHIPNLPFCELSSANESEVLNYESNGNPNKIIHFKNYWKNEDFMKLFVRGLMNSSCNKCYALDIIRANGIRFKQKYPEDTAFNLEYLKHINETTYISSPLYYYIKRAGSVTSKAYSELYEGYIDIQKKLYDKVPKELWNFVDEFVYPQYLANTRMFMHNGDYKTEIPFLKNKYIKKAIKSHKSTCFGDFLVKKLFQFRLLKILNRI